MWALTLAYRLCGSVAEPRIALVFPAGLIRVRLLAFGVLPLRLKLEQVAPPMEPSSDWQGLELGPVG